MINHRWNQQAFLSLFGLDMDLAFSAQYFKEKSLMFLK